ncbi:autotransporter outer membrane beta-barrel domain-containing protein [Segetibacter sp.]|uniref:autotransporter outer membrane beta-barrel domain-containing protein n=1 Tax=Segetibacter sp. TaxID=2231182 RepID=UPI00261FE17C|nr:autotransporter outer membrane beta-barrel domain-containing protein [Segetibacter sp.]MCW3080506.1 hypothetical protein [Segetibacter sp.]
MKKILLLCAIIFLVNQVNAQLEVVKIIGKNSKEYKLGYGGFLKFSYPISETADLTLEGGALIFRFQDDPSDGMVLIPVKAGYRYALNGTGTGFYIEPQAGYTVHGANSNEIIKGFTWAAGTGYLFQPSGSVQFDLGLRYESVIYGGGSINYVGLRLSHNFSFKKRDSGY